MYKNIYSLTCCCHSFVYVQIHRNFSLICFFTDQVSDTISFNTRLKWCVSTEFMIINLNTCLKEQLGIFKGVGKSTLKDTPPMSREQH